MTRCMNQTYYNFVAYNIRTKQMGSFNANIILMRETNEANLRVQVRKTDHYDFKLNQDKIKNVTS